MSESNLPQDEDCIHGYLLGLNCLECKGIVIFKAGATTSVDQEPLGRASITHRHRRTPAEVQLDRRGRILPKGKRKRAKPKFTNEQIAKSMERLNKARLNLPITVTLNLQHTRNGVNYGPGTGKLPRLLALELLAEEQANRKAETNFRGTRSVIIGPRDRKGQVRVIEVPAETFELPYDNPNLYADRIAGNKYGSDTGEGGKF